MTKPCDLSAVEARRLIGRKALSPVELMESCLARVAAVDHAVNAFSTLDADGARAGAREAEAAGLVALVTQDEVVVEDALALAAVVGRELGWTTPSDLGSSSAEDDAQDELAPAP